MTHREVAKTNNLAKAILLTTLAVLLIPAAIFFLKG